MTTQKTVTPWPEPDWTPVRPFPFAAARNAFGGLTSQKGLIAISYYRRPAGDLVATVEFGPMSEGAPGLVHGGAILTALDEALGAAAWVAGLPSLTVRLETEFRKSVPLDARLLVLTRVTLMRSRLAQVEGELAAADGAVYAQAVGRFMRLDEGSQRRMFGRAAGRCGPAEAGGGK